jgi:hypothetical protein
MALSTIPFPLKLRSKTCQICQYEMKNDKWKGVVFFASHGVRLCTESSLPRALTGPELVKLDGSKVTDFSWMCPDEGSCWEKFHNYYVRKGWLFNSKQIDISQQKIKFGGPIYISNLYQSKYKALGIEIVVKEGKTVGMGKLEFERHVTKNK